MLSVAAFSEGRHAQAFPSFGSERTGAPVVSFCRIADHPIRAREPIAEPDALIVQDPTLLHQVDLFGGLRPDGYVLLARRHLGRPLPNAVLLGGFAALTGLISIDSVEAAIRERFPAKLGDANSEAARAAYDYVLEHAPEPSRA